MTIHKLSKRTGVPVTLGLLMATVGGTALAADTIADNGHNWTGLYFGAFGGVAASDGLLDDAYCRDNLNSPDPDNCSDDQDPTDTPELYGAPVDGNSLSIGGLIGYNLQTNSGLVVGLESDLGYGGRGKGSFEGSTGGVSSFDKGEIDIGLNGSTRLRAGFALDKWLPFITGGIAYAQYDTRAVFPDRDVPNRSGDGNFIGWTVGAGLNYALTSNIIFGAEYRYTDFGSDTFFDDDFGSHEASFDQHEIRATVAYALGATDGPSDTQSAGDWSGLYAGVYGGHASLDGVDDNTFCRVNGCGTTGTYGAPIDGGAITFGGLIGYNHQFDGGFVVGFEGDLGIGGKAKGNFVTGNDGPRDQVAKVDLGITGSARLRAGYAINQWMPFATVGLAYTQYDVTTSGPNADENRFGNGNLLGWTAGAGLNYAIAEGVIVGAEYRYTDYGSDKHLYYSDADGDTWSQDVDLKQHEVRASLAYQF